MAPNLAVTGGRLPTIGLLLCEEFHGHLRGLTRAELRAVLGPWLSRSETAITGVPLLSGTLGRARYAHVDGNSGDISPGSRVRQCADIAVSQARETPNCHAVNHNRLKGLPERGEMRFEDAAVFGGCNGAL
jgi:hypothetical protein